MKISRKQIQKIIKEEIADILDVEHPSDVEAIVGVWSGDIEGEAKNLSLDIDHPKAAGAEETTKEPEMLPRHEDLVSESKKVKITMRHLRRIIRESMNEYGDRYPEERYDDPDADPFDDQESDAHPEREELMTDLEKKYGLKSKTSEDFGIGPGGVWINAESDVPETQSGLPLFDYYLDMEPYEFGVHPEFSKFVQDRGFFAEWNDPGTLTLFRM